MDNLLAVQVHMIYARDAVKYFELFIEPIIQNLCNNLICGDGRCIVTSRNVTYCRCPLGITGANCNERKYSMFEFLFKQFEIYQ